MTTGREALAEAARQETARVYGRLCTERRPPVDETVETPARPVRDTGKRVESPTPRPDSGRVTALRLHYANREVS